VIVLAVKSAHSKTEGPIIVHRDFVQAEMVKLGKPREKFWLPRITQPRRRRRPTRSSSPGSQRQARAQRGAQAGGSEDVEGRETRARARAQAGRAGGPEEPWRARRRIEARDVEPSGRRSVRSAVIATIRQNYNLPAGMSPEQIPDPPEVQFRVTADGTITKVKLNKPSGNPLVDDACVSAAQQTRKVDAPPRQARAYLVACQK
jgi:hypothetical protein